MNIYRLVVAVEDIFIVSSNTTFTTTQSIMYMSIVKHLKHLKLRFLSPWGETPPPPRHPPRWTPHSNIPGGNPDHQTCSLKSLGQLKL